VCALFGRLVMDIQFVCEGVWPSVCFVGAMVLAWGVVCWVEEFCGSGA